MLKGSSRRFVVAVLLLSACSGNSASNGAESNEAGFKSGEVVGISVGAGTTTLVALPFVAPSDGFVSVSATGTCTVVSPLPVTTVLLVQIVRNPSDDQEHSGDASFQLGAFGADPTLGSFSAMRVLPAQAGSNSVSLTLDNPSSGGTLYCSAIMTVLFVNQPLP